MLLLAVAALAEQPSTTPFAGRWTPFGTYLELISYPQGEAYAENAPIPLWDPRDNRP